MRTKRDRIVFLMSAVLTGLITMALASAATSRDPLASLGGAELGVVRSDFACAPSDCSTIVKGLNGQSPDRPFRP